MENILNPSKDIIPMDLTSPILGIISLEEIFYLLVLTLVIAYIFMGDVKLRPRTVYDMMYPRKFFWKEFQFAAMIAAPGVILHELGHKFVAMGLGYSASFFIWPFGLFLGVFLKVIGSPFVLIAPGYVGLSNVTNNLDYRIIAFAGPLVNLIIFSLCWYIIKKYRNKLNFKNLALINLTKKINGVLFVFNMLPIPPLDGSKVLFGF